MKSILSSILIHFFFIYNTILIFPPKSLTTKPLLIFLGSILQKEDLVVYSTVQPNGNTHIPAIPLPLYSTEDSHAQHAGQTSVRKPSFNVVAQREGKAQTKTTFENQLGIPAQHLGEHILGIETKTPEWAPLKIE